MSIPLPSDRGGALPSIGPSPALPVEPGSRMSLTTDLGPRLWLQTTRLVLSSSNAPRVLGL